MEYNGTCAFEPQAGDWWDNLPNEAYHHAPGISSTRLREILRSPLRYKVYQPKKRTDAMLAGSVLHTAVLEPHRLDEEYIFARDVDGRTTAGKAYLEEVETEAVETGRIVVRRAREDFVRIADGVRSHVGWEHLCGPSPLFERSYWWEDPEIGELFKCRPDLLNLEWGENILCVDLKKSKCFEDRNPQRSFESDVLKHGWHFQMAMYRAGLKLLIGMEVEWAWFAFQDQPPYESAIFVPGVDLREMGDRAYEKAVKTLGECLLSDSWPGFAAGRAVTVHVPEWAKESDDD